MLGGLNDITWHEEKGVYPGNARDLDNLAQAGKLTTLPFRGALSSAGYQMMTNPISQTAVLRGLSYSVKSVPLNGNLHISMLLTDKKSTVPFGSPTNSDDSAYWELQSIGNMAQSGNLMFPNNEGIYLPSGSSLYLHLFATSYVGLWPAATQIIFNVYAYVKFTWLQRSQ